MDDPKELIIFFRTSARDTQIMHYRSMMTKAADELEAYVKENLLLLEARPGHPR